MFAQNDTFECWKNYRRSPLLTFACKYVFSWWALTFSNTRTFSWGWETIVASSSWIIKFNQNLSTCSFDATNLAYTHRQLEADHRWCRNCSRHSVYADARDLNWLELLPIAQWLHPCQLEQCSSQESYSRTVSWLLAGAVCLCLSVYSRTNIFRTESFVHVLLPEVSLCQESTFCSLFQTRLLPKTINYVLVIFCWGQISILMIV